MFYRYNLCKFTYTFVILKRCDIHVTGRLNNNIIITNIQQLNSNSSKSTTNCCRLLVFQQ